MGLRLFAFPTESEKYKVSQEPHTHNMQPEISACHMGPGDSMEGPAGQLGLTGARRSLELLARSLLRVPLCSSVAERRLLSPQPAGCHVCGLQL